MSAIPTDGLSHRDRMRRVVLLCVSFARNVAFYRAGWSEDAQPLLSERHPEDAAFWRQVNANFIDMAVLEWCKLFGNQKGTPNKRLERHHWRRVVSDPEGFEAGLLAQLQMDEAGLGALIDKMRSYRDEFVAHLDDKLLMYVPELDAAREAVAFYHRHIVEFEAQPGELAGLPGVNELALGYDQCTDDAARVYAVCMARKPA